MRLVVKPVVLVVFLWSTFGLASTVSANSAGVTKGDAQAVFQTIGAGGQAILAHASENAAGAPAQVNWFPVLIHPNNPVRNFCELDWHTFQLALTDGGNYASYSNQEAKAFLEAGSVVFELDGVVVPTETTPVKRWTNLEALGVPEWEFAWWRNHGTVLPPGTPAVGTHELKLTITEPIFGTDVVVFSFTIDAAGTGSCLDRI